MEHIGIHPFGKHLKAFLKNFFLTFTFHKICKLNMYVLLQFLYYLIFFIFVTLCAIMYAILINSFSNEQNLQSNSQNQIKLAEESLNRFETD